MTWGDILLIVMDLCLTLLVGREIWRWWRGDR